MSLFNNNITIYPISGYSPSFSWQVGFNDIESVTDDLRFRATVRPMHGFEAYTRIPSSDVLYEETGIVLNNSSSLGQWTFPLSVNADLTGGPYRDFQVVIEAHNSDGETSAGNDVGTDNENGWAGHDKGYDIIAIENPRQTGIELGKNLLTQNTANGDFLINTGQNYRSLNYMTNGEISIRYLSGYFNSNLVGGYVYVWSGQFPKYEASMGVSGYAGVSKSRFDFNPNLGYVHGPTAAMAFRGANSVYASVSFYDNLDQIALNKGIDISTGLYLSDNAICYNDIGGGTLTLGGGITSIYTTQLPSGDTITGHLGTGISILSSYTDSQGITSVTYIPYPGIVTGVYPYGDDPIPGGTISSQPGGLGGGAVIVDNNPPPPIAPIIFSAIQYIVGSDSLIVIIGENFRAIGGYQDGDIIYAHGAVWFQIDNSVIGNDNEAGGYTYCSSTRIEFILSDFTLPLVDAYIWWVNDYIVTLPPTYSLEYIPKVYGNAMLITQP